MAVTVNIDHETSHTLTDASNYTSDNGGGKITIVDGGLAGTGHALQVVFDDTTNYYVGKNFNKQTIVEGRFHIDPNTLTMGNLEYFDVLYLRNTIPATFMITRLRRSSGEYKLQIEVYSDAGSAFADDLVITDAEHYLEFQVVSATTDIAADGTAQWWVDGVSQGSAANIDNYNRMNDANFSMRVGKYNAANAPNASGTFYIDEIMINDDGGYIGPHITLVYTEIAYGENNTTLGETEVSWATWSDGAGGTPTIVGDADWGKLQLAVGAEGRSAVRDIGDANSRVYRLIENRYGTGQGTATLQIRGDTTSFLQDDTSPSWETYTVPITRTWRYVQVREIKSS